MLKKYIHRPAHLFLDDTLYFITSAIYRKRHLLANSDLKGKLVQVIQEKFKKYNWELHHWVILDNHYHLLGKSNLGKDLSKIFGEIHGSSSSLIQRYTKCEKPIWYQYWDYCPRNERQYFTRLNYLLYNPVKHGYVKDLHDYPFSSFHKLFDEIGYEGLSRQFRQYPEYNTLVLEEAMRDDF